MIELKQISLDELEDAISISYLGDEDLFDKYHVDPFFTFEDCVESTFEMVKENSKYKECYYYKVLFEDTEIGYVVTYKECLFSFGINIEYRRKSILIEWWSKVKEVLDETFLCMLYDNNTRAIDFLKKNGMIEIDNKILEDNIVILINN
jgi:hypothetical protein